MSDSGKNGFWAFAAGLLAGGVAAILFAPAKGSETRKKIKEVAEDGYEKGEELYHKGREGAEKIYHDGREAAEKVYADGRETAEKIYDEGRELIRETTDFVRGKVTKEGDAQPEKTEE